MNGLRRSFIVAFGARELTSMLLIHKSAPFTVKSMFFIVKIGV